ncbi:MAG: RHS repeat-associated core domain-containing protein [Acidobacteriota bacterium]
METRNQENATEENRMMFERRSSRVARLLCVVACILLTPAILAAKVGETELTYDWYGGVSQVATPAGGTVDYEFNLAGAPSSVSYTSPAGAVQPVVLSTSWNQAGSPLARSYGSGDVANYGWDALGRPEEISLDLGGSLPAYRARGFEYDEWGFLASYERYDQLFIAPLEFRFLYSSQGQLAEFHMGPRRKALYVYDAAGNLTQRAGFGYGSLTLPSLAATSYTASNQRPEWSYDGAGRLVEDDAYRYHYNGAGRLVLITGAESGEIVSHYFYDSNGYRVRTLEENRVIYHFRDASGVVISEEVRDVSGDLIESRDFVTAGGQAVAEARHASSGTEEVEYRFTDRLSNPVVRWQESGEKTYQEYSPYGHPMRQATFEPGAHGFTGHEDDPTGLTYMRARYFDPATSRFLQPDPAKAFSTAVPSTFNLYQYTYSNPVNLIDPDGRVPLHEEFRDFWGPTAANRASVGYGMFPVVGEILDAAQVFTGRDYISGEELSGGERVLAGAAALVPIAGASGVRKAFGGVKKFIGGLFKKKAPTPTPGKATVNYHDNHFSIEVEYEGERVLTDLVPEPGTGVAKVGTPDDTYGEVSASVTLDVGHAGQAIEHQKKLLAQDNVGVFDLRGKRGPNCMAHVCDVLGVAGESVPEGFGPQREYLEGLFSRNGDD